jgi:glycosyltransferase involved in cell wall biosynthesis
LFNSSRPLPKFQKILFRFVEKNYLKSIDALILNSQSTLRQAENLLGENFPAHIIATPCGDNFGEDSTVKLRGDAGRIKLLYVGNLIHQKGLHVLLQALDVLKNVEWVLTVVGRSELEPNYANLQQKYAREHGLSERVSFIGALDSEALARVYREHDLFIMPSVNEAYGIVYLEAMQFGLPVIGTNKGGGMEIIENEHNGFLIEPGDHKALAAIIRDLAAHPERLSQLSQQARQSYFSHPRWQDSCQSIHEFLKQLKGNRLNREVQV